MLRAILIRVSDFPKGATLFEILHFSRGFLGNKKLKKEEVEKELKELTRRGILIQHEDKWIVVDRLVSRDDKQG